MPEGPEIRRSADAIGAVLDNQQLVEVQLGLPSLQSHHKDLLQQRVLRVTCWGKAMIIHLENALSIYSHNQLYGIWHVSARGEQPDTTRALRLGLHTEKHSAVLYSASDISIWPTERLKEQPLLSKLGPDILDETLMPKDIALRLKSDKFKRRSLTRLYLDQHFLAGIGNYLRSEILFVAGVHPDKTPQQLTDNEMVSLSEASLEVAQRSYKTGGYTVYTDLWQCAKKENADFEQSRFMVFDREGKSCRVCTTPIERVERNGRRLYWCPSCQKA